MLNYLTEAAAKSGSIEVVDILLASGAEINGHMSYYHGHTALQAAAEGGHLAVVERLILAGENINAQNMKNQTAIQLAEMHGHDKVAAALKRAGGRRIMEVN